MGATEILDGGHGWIGPLDPPVRTMDTNKLLNVEAFNHAAIFVINSVVVKAKSKGQGRGQGQDPQGRGLGLDPQGQGPELLRPRPRPRTQIGPRWRPMLAR